MALILASEPGKPLKERWQLAMHGCGLPHIQQTACGWRSFPLGSKLETGGIQYRCEGGLLGLCG
jgi:hypothetical protein